MGTWHLMKRRFTYLVNKRCRVAAIGLLKSTSTVTIAFKILVKTNNCIRTMQHDSAIDEAKENYWETIHGKKVLVCPKL